LLFEKVARLFEALVLFALACLTMQQKLQQRFQFIETKALIVSSAAIDEACLASTMLQATWLSLVAFSNLKNRVFVGVTVCAVLSESLFECCDDWISNVGNVETGALLHSRKLDEYTLSFRPDSCLGSSMTCVHLALLDDANHTAVASSSIFLVRPCTVVLMKRYPFSLLIAVFRSPYELEECILCVLVVDLLDCLHANVIIP
jgi:hypothetical protein